MAMVILAYFGLAPWFWADIPIGIYVVNTLGGLFYGLIAFSAYGEDPHPWRRSVSAKDAKEKRIALMVAWMFFLDVLTGVALLPFVLSLLTMIAFLAGAIITLGLALCEGLYSEFHRRRFSVK